MRKILFVVIFLIAASANAQNAYYDSKYIIDWMNYPQKDTAAERKAQAIVLNILERIVEKPSDDVAKVKHYAIIDSIYAKLASRNSAYINLDSGKHKKFFNEEDGITDNDGVALSEIRAAIKKYDEHNTAIGENSNAIQGLDRMIGALTNDQTVTVEKTGKLLITTKDTFSPINSISIPFRTKEGEMFVGSYKIFDNVIFALESQDSLEFKKSVLDSIRIGLINGIHWRKEKKVECTRKVQDMFLTLHQDVQKKFIKEVFDKNNVLIPSQFSRPHLNLAEQQQQMQIRIEAQQSQPTVQLANFKMPSQSDMIDALAIYVAKRFKQEAIIFMIDKLKDNLLADTLFIVLFPETQKLLFSQEAFAVPHFGAEWKYAISKDYTLMADHILQSDYIGDNLRTKSFDLMHDAWMLAKMVEKKYSYVEIVRNYAKSEVDSLRTDAMKTFTKLSHIINEELFTSLTPMTLGVEWSDSFKKYVASVEIKDYWVSPANFEKEVSYEQLSLMLAMIEKPHNINVSDQLGIDLSASLKEQVARLERIKKWMSHNLLILNQFQKNQNTLFNKVTDDDKALFNGVTYWSFMTDIVESFLNPDVIVSLKDFKPADLQYVSKVNEIYASFQNKNYPAAITQTMGILDNLCDSRTGYMLSRNIDYAFDRKTNFSKKKPGRFGNLSDEFVNYSTAFSVDTNKADAQYVRTSIIGSLDSLKTAMINDRVNYDTAAFNDIRSSLVNYDWKIKKHYKTLNKKMNALAKRSSDREVGKRMVIFKKVAASRVALLSERYRNRLLEYQDCYCKHLGKAKRYASFLTDVMGAGSNPQMLSRVIETHAAPPASYKLKRYNKFTIDLGAYLGAYVGGEIAPVHLRSLPDKQVVYGLSVPVGFNFTWAPTKKLKPGELKYPVVGRRHEIRELRGVSHTLSLSIVDIAAPVAYRLTNGSDGALPKEVKWSQLFSPGIHWRWGLKNAPVCVSLGAQYTPQLRTMASGIEQNAMRVYAGIFFDMPLLFIKK